MSKKTMKTNSEEHARTAARQHKRDAIDVRDLVTIGIFGALSLLIFAVVGGIAGLTVVGVVANIPIVCFFTPIVYLLLAAKVKKRGTFLIMGTINVLPGLMAANVIGVILSILGWAVAELVASSGGYANKKALVAAYTIGCTLYSACFTFPMYFASVQYLGERQEMLHLTEEALSQYLALFSWPLFGAMVALTAVSSLLGALLSLRLLKKHFVKAGLV